MGVLKEYHEALGDLIFRFEGTLERFAGDGLMVFFNDPVRCDDGAAARDPDGVAMRTRVRGAGGVVGAPGARPRAGDRHRPGLRDAGRIGFDGRLDYAAIGSVTNLAARLCDDAEPWQILVTERVFAAAGLAGRRRGRRRSRAARLQPDRPRVRRQGRRQLTGRVMTGDLWTAPVATDRRALAACPRRSGTGASTICRHGWPGSGTRCGSTMTTSPSSSSPRSRSTGPWPQRQPDPGLRGALPVPAHAAPPAAAADDLRDLDADRTRDHRVLPGAAPRRHPQPRAGPAVAGRRQRLRPHAR